MVEVSHHMLMELLETVKLGENLSWPIARGVFAIAIHSIKHESISWGITRFLAEH